MIRGEVKNKVLKYLSPSEPKRFIKIHEESSIAQSSLAKFLAELVRDGFVKRTEKGYVLTEKGKQHVAVEDLMQKVVVKFNVPKVAKLVWDYNTLEGDKIRLKKFEFTPDEGKETIQFVLHFEDKTSFDLAKKLLNTSPNLIYTLPLFMKDTDKKY
jgi:DNA-binding HxlR family transcriptional regulator